MNIIYSGKTKDFTPELEEKLSTKLSKLSKLVEQKGEREAHVNHHMERHLHKVQIGINIYEHSLVGEGCDGDLSTSLAEAVDRIEKQIVRLRTRSRDTQRDPKGVRDGKESGLAADSAERLGTDEKGSYATQSGRKPREKHKIFEVDYDSGQKPMTLEEALIEIESDETGYVVFRDSEHSCLSVLIRRPDGHFDLVRS